MGGPGRVALTLEHLSGLSISGFLGVNLAGFQKVVDALGGIPICVDRPMVDTLSGLNITAGCHLLNGFQALAFVRARHVQGDWGLVDAEDAQTNNEALHNGGRLLSVYETRLGTRLWIITESDRHATTILLPDEY